ncbi:1605_t:CDS:10 [Entrophospora sp. SA101]|nr:1605_t:CDS:10 [Entrophospora sp. SA101]
MDNSSWLEYVSDHPVFYSDSVKLSGDTIGLENYGKPKRKQTCIAIEGNNLILAVGSEIRILNLLEFKDAWQYANENDELHEMSESDDSNHDNDDDNDKKGNVISVAGDYELAVVRLPLVKFNLSASEKKVDCVTYPIGSFHHMEGSSPISKILWHPLTRIPHLLPEQKFCFSENPEKTFSFGAEIPKAVSFCFGQGNKGWSNFTVYVLFDNGDVYAMCPIVEFSSPANIQNDLLLQGPFSMRPNPLELSHHPFDASDIIYLNTQPTSVIVIASSNGRLDIFLEVDKIEAFWKIQGLNEFIDSPVLLLYESIDLGFIKSFVTPTSNSPFSSKITTSLNHPVLLEDPQYKDMFYVCNFAGVHAIRLEVSWIACVIPSNPDPLIGLVIVDNAHLGYLVLILTSTLQLKGFPLESRTTPIKLSIDDVTRLKSMGFPETDKLEFPIKLQEVLTSQGLTCQPILLSQIGNKQSSKEFDRVNSELIRGISLTIVNEIIPIKSSAHILINRIKLQFQMIKHQADLLQDLKNTMEENKHLNSELDDRVNKIKQKHSFLESKANQILQKRIIQSNPILGEFENEYFDMLNRVQEDLNDENGLKAKVKQIQLRHSKLSKYNQPKSKSNHSNSNQIHLLTGSQLHKVETALDKEMELIEEATSKIQVAQEKLKNLNLDNISIKE